VVQDGGMLLVGEPALRRHVPQRCRHDPDWDAGVLGLQPGQGLPRTNPPIALGVQADEDMAVLQVGP
jgi:hypothetical protein